MKKISNHQLNLFQSLLKEKNIEVQELCIYQRGTVLLDKTYAPFHSGILHPLYSISKSFTSIAIGFLMQEKRLRLEDRWISFFPEYQEDVLDPKFYDVTIRDLLTMTMGQDQEAVVINGDDWIENIVSKPLAYLPSKTFFYNSMCSMLLSVLIQKLSGKKEEVYLEEHLFQPLGIQNWYWEEDERGHSIGGFGLHLSMHDLLKFGVFLLQEGNIEGRQLMDPAWIRAATSLQVQTDSCFSQERSENCQGYGYHFWRCNHGAYRCSGMYGQICMVIPSEQVVLVVHSSTTGSQPVLDCFWEAMYHPEEAVKSNYFIPFPEGNISSPWQKLLFGTFKKTGFDSLMVMPEANSIKITWVHQGKKKELSCGYHRWIQQPDTFTEADHFMLHDEMKKYQVERNAYAAYAWVSDTILKVAIRADDYVGRETVFFQVDGKYLKLTYDISSFLCATPHAEYIFKRIE